MSSNTARRWVSRVMGLSAVVTLLLACGVSQTTPTPTPAPSMQAVASTPMPGPSRILFVGNSLTFFNNLPETFAELARSGGHAVEVGISAQGGQTLAGHSTSATTLKKITGQRWDYLVLQEQSRIPAIAAQRNRQMVPAARLLDEKGAESGANTVLFLTWASREGLPRAGIEDYAAMQTAIEAGYLEVAGEIGAMVAPVGVAWQRALEEHQELELWARDGSHPTPAGTYLAACVFYATLLGESPEGASYLAGLPEETAWFLQSVAADTVLRDPERWDLP